MTNEMTLRDVIEYAGLNTSIWQKGGKRSLTIVCNQSIPQCLGALIEATQGDYELVLELADAIRHASFTAAHDQEYIVLHSVELNDHEEEDE